LDKEEEKCGLLFSANVSMGNNIPSGIVGCFQFDWLYFGGFFCKRQYLFLLKISTNKECLFLVY